MIPISKRACYFEKARGIQTQENLKKNILNENLLIINKRHININEANKLLVLKKSLITNRDWNVSPGCPCILLVICWRSICNGLTRFVG